ATAWGIAILYPVGSYLKKPEDPQEAQAAEVNVGNISDIPPGQSKTFRFGKQPALLIRDKDGNFRAFDATCSHLGCTVQHRRDRGDIFSACHEGIYDLSGKNVAGPPPRPLNTYQVAVRNNQIFVSKA